MSTTCFILVTFSWHFFYPGFHIEGPHYYAAMRCGGKVGGCGSVFPLSEMGLFPEFWWEGNYLPGVLGQMGVLSPSSGLLVLSVQWPLHSRPWACFYFILLTYSFGPGKYYHQKERVNNLSIEFCVLRYCHERILYNWQAFVSNKRNAFLPAQDANLKGKEHRQEILAIRKETEAVCSSLVGNITPGLVLLGVV